MLRRVWNSYTCSFLILLALSMQSYAKEGGANHQGLRVAAQGWIMPQSGLVMLAPPAGLSGFSVVKALEVGVGDTIKKDQVLARMDDEAQAEVGVHAAEAELKLAQEAVAVARSQAKAADGKIHMSQQQLAVAQAQLAQASAGLDKAKRAKEQGLAEQVAAVHNLRGRIDAYQAQIDKWDPPRRDREEIKLEQQFLALEIDKLQASQASLEATMDAEIAQAQRFVDTAQGQLTVAEAGKLAAQTDSETALAQVNRLIAQVDVATLGVGRAKLRLENTQLRSPLNGIVLAINTHPGEAVSQLGIMFIGDNSKMRVDAEVYVDDVSRLKVGQMASVTSSSFDGALSGKVSRIDPMVSAANLFDPDPSAFTDRRVVAVTIELDDGEVVSHLTNAQVAVLIETGEASTL